jgi:anti-sigma B factor antagonist
MLDIIKKSEDNTLTLQLSGRLDTDTASQLDDEIAAIPDMITNLVIDMDDLEYVASSGLRVLLMATKTMRTRGGDCTMVNVPELIMEVFEMTGLTDVFSVA